LSVAAALSAAAADRGGSVGLVLSGGGAKGIAHIGVLQALEDNDIPIDYVAGTSMGAIVGGLYAAGYTPAEMMDLILSKGFADWSTGKIDEKLAYYFSRPAPSPAMITIPVARRDSSMVNSILPTSVISPLPMNFAFMELFSAYTAQCGGDFDKLFVPYRCVASDVYAKRKIVCRGGSLGDAIRASMSFPAVYQPIEMNGVLVYDGGIYDNFPVDVMRSDFAPSIMIGVDVTTPDGKPKSGDVIEQLEDMIIQNNDYSLPADEGIKIHLDLRRFNLLDFAKAEAIYKVGYDRAMEMMDSIKTRVTARVPREARQLSRRVFKSASPYLRFDSVEVTGGNSGQNDYIRYLFTKNRADTFGISSARDSYYQAITPGNLRDLLPTAVYNPSSSLFKLNLKATVKDSFKVGFGGYLSSSTNSMIFLSAGYNSLSFHGVEAIVKGWVGQSYMAGALNARVYMPTGVPSALSLDAVVSRQRFYESASLFYQDKMPAFITNTEAFARLNFSAAAGRSGTFAAGVGFGHLFDSFYQSNDGGYYGASRDRAIYNLAQARVDYRRNTLDNNNFPTAGSSYSLTAIGVTGGYRFHPATPAVESQHLTSTWGQLRLQAKNFFGLGSKLAFGTAVDCLASSRPLVDNYNAAVVAAPSFKPTQSSYNAFNPAFSANSYVSAGLLPVWIPVSSLQLRGDFYCFLPYKKIKEQPDGTARYGRAFSDPAFLGEMALVYNFPFASLSLYGNYMSYPARNWNFGVTFGLFYLAPRFLR
jgi:NTE family protein